MYEYHNQQERNKMSDFHKVVRLGTGKTHKGGSYSIFCAITYIGGKLSITGVEGPRINGNAYGSCGQIVHSLSKDPGAITLAPGWTAPMLARFLQEWDQWHLNDMQAGSPAQVAELAKHTEPEASGDYYGWACSVLQAAGINPDPGYIHNGKPYSYGSAWLKKEVPADVLEFLRSLPDTDITPAWV